MKPSWGLVVSSLCCAASAASKSVTGHVYTHDPAVKSKHIAPSSVSPSTARLILAQRLGLSRYHSLDNVDEDLLWMFNQYGYGGRTQQLFGQDQEINQAHALIWLDGVDDAQSIIDQATDYAQFTFNNAPPSSSNAHLLRDFATQAKSLPKRPAPLSATLQSDKTIAEILENAEQHNHITIMHENVAKDHKKQEYYRQVITSLLDEARRGSFSVTVVLTPTTTSQSMKHPYGTYSLPSHRLQARDQVPEAILSSSVAAAVASNAANSSENTTPNAPLNKTGPLLGILKVCYDSQSACESATRNCTGHGKCLLSRHGEQKAGGKGKYNDCYSCSCKATVVKRGEGKDAIKTTNWGGPACQKKDVVVEFWLFAGATVMLMFLIGTGIGMLYSMGEEELPSVIGAGVSGPTRK